MNPKKPVMTPARLAFYSSLLFLGTSIPVFVATSFIPIDLVSKDVGLTISALLTFLVACFTLAWFLRRKATRYQIQIITRQGEPRMFSGGVFAGFMFGFFWRSLVVGVATEAIAALLRGAYGSDINLAQSLKIDFLESFLCSFLSFWWVYAAPMGKNRMTFGVNNSEIILIENKTTVIGERREIIPSLAPSRSSKMAQTLATATGSDTIAAIIAVVSIPIMLLNFGGGIIGGIWLAVSGKWGLIGLGILSIFITSFGLALALMPGMLLSLPGSLALERGKYAIGVPCLFAGNLWTVGVVAVWCVGCFHVVFGDYYSGGSVWPYLLWAYGMATGPWTYMVTKSGSDEIGSTLVAFGACLGAISIMGLVIFKGIPSIVDATVAFCIPMAIVLILQTLLAFMMVLEKVRNKHA